VADWSGSHNLRIPARSSTFWVTDQYARSTSGEDVTFSRYNDVNVSAGPGSVTAFSGALDDGASLIQSWGGSTGWRAPDWNAETDIRYILNTAGTEEGPADYFSSWIRDYALILPSDGTVTNREAHHTIQTSAGTGIVSVEWDPELRMKAARAPVWNQENRWAGTLSVPLRFASWSLTPSYRRDLREVEQTGTDEDNRNYGDLWGHFINGTGGRLPIFSYWPFLELFGKKDGESFARNTQGLAEATYETEFALTMSRSAGGGLADLVLPSTGSFSMERDYERKGDTTGWENEWRGSIGFSAVNLFGRFGLYPVLPVYNVDEFTSLLQITLKDYNGIPVPDPEEFLWQTNWSFTGLRGRRLTLDHRLNWNWDPESRNTTQEGRLDYIWRTASQDAFRIPLFNRVIPRQNYLENTERLILTGLYPWKESPPEGEFEIAFTLRHESKWVFQDKGHLKGWLAFGLGDREGEFINGWELGLEAEFRL
jgi:hypothetical protein